MFKKVLTGLIIAGVITQANAGELLPPLLPNLLDGVSGGVSGGVNSTNNTMGESLGESGSGGSGSSEADRILINSSEKEMERDINNFQKEMENFFGGN